MKNLNPIACMETGVYFSIYVCLVILIRTGLRNFLTFLAWIFTFTGNGKWEFRSPAVPACKYISPLINLSKLCKMFSFKNQWNRIDGVMISMLASSVVDCGFKPLSGQTKDFQIGICCVSAKHAVLRSKSKDLLARNQNNVSEWSDMSVRGLLFQWDSTMQIQQSLLVKYKADLIIISSNVTCCRRDVVEKSLIWR